MMQVRSFKLRQFSGLSSFVLLASTVSAQVPIVQSTGVVTASSYVSPIVPGSLMTIFGSNLAMSSQASTAIPLPTTLAGATVTVNGILAPLLFASPGQINAQVPVDAFPSLASDVVAVPVVVITSEGSSAPANVSLFLESPGVFTQDGSGCGRAVALNVGPDGSLSLNTPSNSAAPGDYIALLGTGFGAYTITPSGIPPTGASTFSSGDPTVNFDNQPQNSPASYAGVAPGFVGVHQLNVQLPPTTRESCSLPLTVRGQSVESPVVTISVHSGRGACVDPPIASYGSISLLRTQTNSVPIGTTTESDTFSASFPSGPGVVPPSAPPVSTEFWTYSMAYAPSAHACPVAGYSNLNVGALTISGPRGNVTVQPITDNVGGVIYSANLPVGFVDAGAYRVSSAGSSTVAPFNDSFSIPQPIKNVYMDGQYITNEEGSFVPATWTDSGSGSTVKASAIIQGVYDQALYYQIGPASLDVLNLGPACSLGVAPAPPGITRAPFCPFGGDDNPRQHYEVNQIPRVDAISGFTATGITGTIQPSWTFSYEFYAN